MTTHTAPAGAGRPTGRPVPRPRPVSPPRTRRRPALLALGVALVVVSALGAAALFTAFSGTERVLVVVSAVDAGQPVPAGALAVTDATVTPDLAVVPAGELDDVVGSTALVPLLAGQLLSPDAVGDGPAVPGDGRSVVGLPLARTQLPATGVQAGDTVLVVDTPQAGGDPPSGVPAAIEATVLRVVVDDVDPSLAVVDVVAPVDDARRLAARAGTGRIHVVLTDGVALERAD